MNLIEKNIIFIICIIAFFSFLPIINIKFAGFDLEWLILRVQGLLVGMILFICFLVAIFEIKNKKIFQNFKLKEIDFFVLLFFVIYGLFSTINGFLRQNSIIYIVGDAFHLFSFAFLYFISAIFIQRENIKKIINFSVYLFFILMSIDVVYAFYQYFESGYFRKTAGYFFILPFIYFFIKYVKSQRAEKKSWKVLFSLLTSIFIIFFTVSFALVMTLFLIILIFTFFSSYYKKNYLKFMLIIFFIIGLFFILESFDKASILERISLRALLKSDQVKENIYSYSYRTEEINDIFYTMKDNYLNFIIGTGEGSFRELSLEGNKSLFKFINLHTIHFTPGSVFFRMGLIGLVIFILFLLSTLLFLYNKYKKIDCSQQSNKFYLEVIFFFFIACIILSIRGYGIINAPILAILLGLARNKNFVESTFLK